MAFPIRIRIPHPTHTLLNCIRLLCAKMCLPALPFHMTVANFTSTFFSVCSLSTIFSFCSRVLQTI